MFKLSDNPPVLSPHVDSLTELDGRWWVAHTKGRFEKAFAWDCSRRGIGYFLPMIERVRIYKGRRHHVLLPLFTSYVFFCGDEMARYEAVCTNRLCRVIEVYDQEQLIDELTQLERAVTGEAELDPYPFAAEGRRCRIRTGPFQGLAGVVIRRDKLTRIVLEVSMLGQGAAMEVDADLLEPAD